MRIALTHPIEQTFLGRELAIPKKGYAIDNAP